MRRPRRDRARAAADRAPALVVPGPAPHAHVGGSVPGGMARAYAVAAEQIAAYARGEVPPNLVVDGY